MTDSTLNLDGFIDTDHAKDVRADAYTRPHLVFRVDNYFIDYWLPLLGPTNAWLVVALQQTCWQGSKPGNATQTSQTELGNQCGLGRQRVNELLSDPLVEHFIVGKQAIFQAGQRQPNSYRVRLTSPLIPAHAAGLHQEIAVRLERSETLTEIMQSLIDEAMAARESLLERIALPDTPPSFPLHTITDITHHFTGQEPDKTLRQQIETLAGLLLQPQQRQIEQHYLRREWLPLLGHAGIWMIVVIRRDCYADDNGEVRDDFSVEKAVLTTRLGVSANTIRRLVKNEHLPAFFRPMEGDGAWQSGRFRLEGRVRTGDNPLTPADQKSLIESGTEPAKDDTVNGQKATRLAAERSKSDTVNHQKATRSDRELPKDDTVNGQKATRLAAELPKDDTVNHQKATRSDREPPKDDTANDQKATRSDREPPKDDTVNHQKATRSDREPPKDDTVNHQKATRSDREPPKDDTVNHQKATRSDREPPKDDTVNHQKATRSDREPPKDDTVNHQKATRSDREPPKGDTVNHQKATRSDREPPKGDSDSALFKDSALKDSESESEVVVVVNAHANARETTTTSPKKPEPAEFNLAEYLFGLYREEVGKLTKIIRQQITAGAQEIPDRDIWQRAFIEMAAVAPSPSWRYVLTVARRMQRDAVTETTPSAQATAVTAQPATPSPSESLWQATLEQVKLQMTRQTFDTWLRNTTLISAEDGLWTVEVENSYAKEWLENRLCTTISRAAANVAEREVDLQFVTAAKDNTG